MQMRTKKFRFSLFRILIVVGIASIIVSWSIMALRAYGKDGVRGPQPVKNHLFFSSESSQIDGLLLKKVYVLNTGEILTNKPLNKPVTANNVASNPAEGSVQASFTVAACRSIVLDRSGHIREIWSNARSDCAYYSLQVRQLSRQGLVCNITRDIIDQYDRLISKADWSIIGKVY